MEIGNYILKNLAQQFNEIEARFDLLREIDLQITKDIRQGGETGRIDEFICWLVLNIQKQLGIPTADAFTLLNGEPISMNAKLQGWPDFGARSSLPQLIGSDDQKVRIVETENNEYVHLAVRIAPLHEMPPIFVVLSDNAFGRKVSKLYEAEIQEFCKQLATQSEILIDSKVRLAEETHHRKMLDSFFKRYSDADVAHLPLNSSTDRRWLAIIELFPRLLPNWFPFALERQPLFQVLTYDFDAPDYIVLRATEGEKDVLNLQIEKDKTICGLFVDEDRKREVSHLYVNPKEHIGRYAQFLYDSIPESELVLPIRVKGKLAAMVNIEHPQPGVFTDYHQRTAKRASELITPFVAALIAEERQEYDKEIRLHGTLAKTLRRMKKTYHHKLQNSLELVPLDIGLIEDRNLTNESREAKARALEKIKIAADHSGKFLEEMERFFHFERINLKEELMNAVREIGYLNGSGDQFIVKRSNNKRNLSNGPAQIKITVKIDEVHFPSNCVPVFGSRYIREHIYNVLNNSVQAMDENGVKEGQWIIDIAESRQQDKTEKVGTEYAMLRISDNAGGIPASVLGRIFEFGFGTRADSTGFGLSAAREYMQTIKGDMDIPAKLNKQGVGCVMEFKFPVYDERYHGALAQRMNAAYSADIGDQ